MKIRKTALVLGMIGLLMAGCSEQKEPSVSEMLKDNAKQDQVMDEIFNNPEMMNNMMGHLMKSDHAMGMMIGNQDMMQHMMGNMMNKMEQDSVFCNRMSNMMMGNDHMMNTMMGMMRQKGMMMGDGEDQEKMHMETHKYGGMH